jgi:hypothetical protein
MKKLLHLDHQIDCKERPQHFYFLNHLKKKIFRKRVTKKYWHNSKLLGKIQYKRSKLFIE